MTDRREKIVQILGLFLEKERRSKELAAPFKVKAYVNAIRAIDQYNQPITTKEDVLALTGIGKKIRDKLLEIVETGDLQEAKGLMEAEAVRKDLLNIYGIGVAKSTDLIDNYNVKSIQDLIDLVAVNRDILTPAQTLGLIYYEDFKQRIPREEIKDYEDILHKFFKKNEPNFSMTVVGSYRRGLKDSGDIDILLTYKNMPDEEAQERFTQCIEKLTQKEYLIGVLAKGKSKMLGIVQLPGVEYARRIDILLTPPTEIACSMLYFTGSKEFNVNFRKVALLRGYTLNEHRMEKINDDLPIQDVPVFLDERSIFDFIGVKYQEPKDRIGPVELTF